MRRILEKYFEGHKRSTLCEIGAFRDLLEYNGHNLTIPMVFGISGAMGFGYSYGKDRPIRPDLHLPFTVFSPFNPFPLINATQVTNSWRRFGRNSDKDKAWEDTKTLINEGNPVLVEVETQSYFKKIQLFNSSEISLPQTGGHVVMVYGYDEEDQNVYIVESLLMNPVKINIEEFKLIRSVSDCIMPPQNEWQVFYLPSQLPNMEEMIFNGLSHFVNQMLHPYNFNSDIFFGIDALEQFRKDVFNWPSIMDLDQLKTSLFFVQNFGTFMYPMGGFLRKLMGEFLKECNQTFKGKGFVEIGDMYLSLCALWNRIISQIHLINSDDGKMKLNTHISENKKILNEIFNLEREAAESLVILLEKL
ncbi:MAG: DUF4872 domain-containing protein [Spirochaetaceae bacterium]|nr:DUF4872 domain-containing protein [Spirochaetaceae bacterium]